MDSEKTWTDSITRDKNISIFDAYEIFYAFHITDRKQYTENTVSVIHF